MSVKVATLNDVFYKKYKISIYCFYDEKSLQLMKKVNSIEYKSLQTR